MRKETKYRYDLIDFTDRELIQLGFDPTEIRSQFDEYNPYSKGLGDLYLQTMQELAEPYPSIELANWKMMNDLTGGFRMREFTILCGSTGSGKTTLLSSWAKAFILSQTRCFIMSVETGATDFIKRTMSAFSGYDMNKGRPIDKDKLSIFHNQFGGIFGNDELFLSLYDSRVNPQTVIQDIIWHHKKKNCKIIFIDNLNFLLDVVSQDRSIEVMDKVVHELIMLAKRHDIHIIMVMHPKKTDHGRVESEFDIKGSSTACQEATNIFLFNRPSKSHILSGKYGTFMRQLYIAKLRRKGESVGKSIWLKYQPGSYYEDSIALME